MTDWIDRDLESLANDVQFPSTPDLQSAVLARLAEPRAVARPRPVFARSLLLALLAVVLIAATVAAAAFLLPGFRLSFVPTLPGQPTGDLGAGLVLGEMVDRGSVTVALPESLGAPDAVYGADDGAIVSAVYGVRDGLPEIGDTGVGLLVQAISGTMDTERVRKLAVEHDVTVTPVDIGGSRGYWIEGEPHLVGYFSPTGEERSELTRLVGDTLVWQRDDALYRVESALGRDGTIRVAESIGD